MADAKTFTSQDSVIKKLFTIEGQPIKSLFDINESIKYLVACGDQFEPLKMPESSEMMPEETLKDLIQRMLLTCKIKVDR